MTGNTRNALCSLTETLKKVESQAEGAAATGAPSLQDSLVVTREDRAPHNGSTRRRSRAQRT